jgi:hypothetical protein
VAQDPGRTVVAGGATESVVAESGTVSSREVRVPPYYTLLELPGEDEASFVTLRSFVPISDDDSRKQLAAFMVGETDADGSSRLVSYEMSNLLAPGPTIVASNISTNRDITSIITLLNDQGSAVEFGDLLLLPIADSMLYIRPLYVKAQGTAIPLLAGVVAAVGDETALGTDLLDALEQLYPGEDFSDVVAAPIAEASVDGSEVPDLPDLDDPAEPVDPPSEEPVEPPSDEPPADVAELLAELADLRSQQDDLADQQSETNQRIDDLIERLLAQLGGSDAEPAAAEGVEA